jgi:hypothetical protein
MGDAFVISGLRGRRAALARQIIDAQQQQLDRLHGDLIHIDAVLRLYGVEAGDVPMKGRVSIRSAYFDRNEISRRIRDLLRDRETISADDVSVRAMQDKRLDPDRDRKLRTDFTKRVLVSLHDMLKAGQVERIGFGRGVRWKIAPREADLGV